jgi:hypothetical protein
MTPPPRDLTPAVRRRAWGDPLVRFWWLTAAVMLLIALVLATMSYLEWSRLARAIRPGVVVMAKLTSTEGDTRVGRSVTSTMRIGMDFTYNGKEYKDVQGVLTGLQQQVRVGDQIPLHIDPNDPLNWTVRDKLPPLALAMIGPILVLPVALICGLIAVANRSSVLKTYRDGRLADAIVAANKQTPLAPRSRAVRCSLTAGSRMMEVYVPNTAGRLNEGDPVQVLVPTRGRPLAAAWFEEE